MAAESNEITALRAPARSASDACALAPGLIIADRFRIVARIGRGGMGEVYRADDLRLGQKVALKRLPPQFRSHALIDVLYEETRNGRDLAHPNLCRIYDLVETESDCFVAMEFVEGENLASLLRRIGRLPHQKCLDITWDLIAGLGAMHQRGLLHRDLKPANVVLDDEGRARIVDFGLVLPAGQAPAGDRSGTLLYMAPEVAAGARATVKSDLYSLGLVLYEVFTGRHAHSSTIGQGSNVAPPSRFCPNLDPDIERLILACLERDPDDRPRSVSHVRQMLPGAAGEPARHRTFGISEQRRAMEDHHARSHGAAAAFVVALLSLAAVTIVSGRTGIQSRLADSPSPAVLAERVRALLDSCGVSRPAQTHYAWVAAGSGNDVEPLFLYREAQKVTMAANEWGRWSLRDPAAPGMTTVLLDAKGRLRSLTMHVPLERREASNALMTLLEAADVDLTSYVEGTPIVVPPTGHDEHLSWIATTGRRDSARVEAAFVFGSPVYFDVLRAGSLTPTINEVREVTEPDLGFPPLLYMIVATGGLFFAAIAARHNFVRGRADRRGAFRLALYIFIVTLAACALLANHALEFPSEWKLAARAVGNALLHAASVWIVYLAVESYARRRWPHMLMSWMRIMSGRALSPEVGRDTLVGLAAGLCGRLILSADEAWPSWFAPRAAPHLSTFLALGSPSDAAFVALYYQFTAIFFSLGIVFLLLVIRRVAPTDGIALVAVWLIVSAVGVAGHHFAVELTLSLLRNALLVAVLYRFGVHALAVSWLTYYAVLRIPLTIDTNAWFATRSFVAVILLAIACTWSYWLWAGRRSVVRRLLSEPNLGRT